MTLDRRGNVTDVLGLIAGARNPKLVDVDVEAGAVADAHAAADPDARAHATRAASSPTSGDDHTAHEYVKDGPSTIR